MKYFRKRRAFRRFSRRRRIFRKPRVGSKRFFNRQRRSPKVEIKFMQKTDVYNVPFNFSSSTTRITPLSLGVGSTNNQRIGKMIKYRKLNLNVEVRSYDQGGNRPVGYHPDWQCRIVIWSPVTQAAQAIAYLDGSTPFTFAQDVTANLDWNIMRVHRDVSFRIGRSSFVATPSPTFVIATQPDVVMKKFVIPVPRTVEFPTSDLIDADRHSFYMTVFKTQINVNPLEVSYTARTTYIE